MVELNKQELNNLYAWAGDVVREIDAARGSGLRDAIGRLNNAERAARNILRTVEVTTQKKKRR